VARASFNLPYMDAVMSLARRDSGCIEYQSRRTHRGEPLAEYHASYGADGNYSEAEAGSLEHWLTARYCLYSANRKGCLFRGEIDHPPWQLAPATYTERSNTMGKPLGFAWEGKPHLLCAKPIDVRAWMVARCSDR
jgi:uncharacterized protein YqjF (DUF2071 family)